MSDCSLYMIILTLETCLWVLMLLNVLVRNLNNTYDKAEMNQILSSETSGSPAHGPSEQTHKYQRNIERRRQTNEIWLYLHRWHVCWVCEAEAGADERVRICLSCSLCKLILHVFSWSQCFSRHPLDSSTETPPLDEATPLRRRLKSRFCTVMWHKG